MPELPEVETTVRGLARVLEGRRLARIEARRPDLRRPFPDDLGQRLTGAIVTGLARRAKYGLIHTDRSQTLVFHLGMSGRWRIDPSEIDKHDHLIIETDDGGRAALNDPRRFGSLDLVCTPELERSAPFDALGPEPLDISPEQLKRRLSGRGSSIKQLLLDQGVIAGLGNIYVCEALHRSGIHPMRRAGSVSLERLKLLVPAIQNVLIEAIAAGGSTLRDFASPTGELGYFSKSFSVYGRENQPCACGTPVKRITQAGRSTFYCSACQH